MFRHRRLFYALAALYGLCAVVTFGHAAAASTRAFADERARCDRLALERPRAWCHADNWSLSDGLGAGLAWPLYWSWEAWS